MSDTAVQSLAEAIPELRRPFTAAAVKWKLQTNPKDDDEPSALAVGFHDARLVSDRLNNVCPGDWSTEYVRDDVFGMVRCKLTVFGVTREDVGFAKGEKSDMAVKGLYSDAFKRSAVHFGIGASLYAIPALWVRGQALKKGGNGKWFLSTQGVKELRGRYDGFLETIGESAYGKPLDHGDPDEIVDESEAGPTVGETYKFGPEGHDYARRALAVLLGRKADTELTADQEKEARTWWRGLTDDQERWRGLLDEAWRLAVAERLNELRGEKRARWRDGRGVDPYSEAWGGIFEVEKREPLLAAQRNEDGDMAHATDPLTMKREAGKAAERRFADELTEKGADAFVGAKA